jgi:hypothetical protein
LPHLADFTHPQNPITLRLVLPDGSFSETIVAVNHHPWKVGSDCLKRVAVILLPAAFGLLFWSETGVDVSVTTANAFPYPSSSRAAGS